MKIPWLLLAPALALAVLAAHFQRAGIWPLALACLGLIGLLALPRPWVAAAMPALLLAGALEWAWTAIVLVQRRLALGQPWLRLALILAAVALLTAAAALVFRRARVRAWYTRRAPAGGRG
jgi:hypothetical protein